MAAPKKLLIITSNEDVIRQFTSQQIKDTSIIDLDNEKQLISTDQNNNTNIIATLSSLSQLNSSKRLLDSSESPPDHPCKSVKTQKNSAEHLCTICGDNAIGYNYDALSCASCKIFFRRNANQDLRTMRCLSGTCQCSVEFGRRRKCPRCRLQRCFSQGMKKEFILTEKEKEKRRKTNDQTSRSPCGMLSDDDKSLIEQLRSTFQSILDEGKDQCACVDVSDRTSALISWSEYLQKVALSFIRYLRQIDQFEKLNFDDRLILIKYNVYPITLISKCYHYKSTNDCCSDDDNEHSIRQRRFFLLCSGTTEARPIFVQMIVSLVRVTKQDPILLSLLSALLIFSRGLSMDENEPILKDPHAVYQAEAYFTKLLCNYLIDRLGRIGMEKCFSQLLMIILKIQSSSKKLRQYFHTQYTTSNTVDRMAPIMQSLLRI